MEAPFDFTIVSINSMLIDNIVLPDISSLFTFGLFWESFYFLTFMWFKSGIGIIFCLT